MRTLLFVISLFSCLLSGGQTVMASCQASVYEQKHHLTSQSTNLVDLDSLVTFVEDTDVDAADENDLSKENISYSFEKTTAIPHFVHIPWLKAPPASLLRQQISKNYCFNSPNSESLSIYLKHRNLRIWFSDQRLL